jgi:hypothetical protein
MRPQKQDAPAVAQSSEVVKAARTNLFIVISSVESRAAPPDEPRIALFPKPAKSSAAALCFQCVDPCVGDAPCDIAPQRKTPYQGSEQKRPAASYG